jgi:TM2 domain-containing membrane protein YozV
MDGENDGQIPPVRPPSLDAVPMRVATEPLPPHPLDKEWFAYVDGKSYGPYSGHDIRRMVEKGQIHESDHLCPNNGTAWVVAKNDPILGTLFRSKQQGALGVGAAVTANGGTIVQVTNNIPQPNYAALLLEGGMLKQKSPGVALFWSFLICGTGQMYNGQVGKGFAMLIGSVFLWFFYLGWIIWIWAMIDAYTTAKEMNLRYQRLLLGGTV